MGQSSNRPIQNLLVCPVCKGALDFSPGLIRCTSCDSSFPQPDGECFDLMPYHLMKGGGTRWDERQHEMEGWYRDLISKPTQASSCLAHDYEPYASLLATFSGIVLDVGGGVGIVRHYLPQQARYIVVDPSLDWLGSEWTSIAATIPVRRNTAQFRASGWGIFAVRRGVLRRGACFLEPQSRRPSARGISRSKASA